MPAARNADTPGVVITVKGLSKRYGRLTAVHDLSFSVEEGEVLGFLGPNGAGKTTTMRMVTGYLPPSGGRVSIAGFDLYDNPLEAKRHIGYLPENPPVYPEMTVRRYLRFVADLKDVPRAGVGDAVDWAIDRAHLREVADKRIAKLSKGFRQRVGLAQAIVHRPKVLILDEPTSSLDPKQRTEVRELIGELRGGHTILVSTHILPEISTMADRVVIMHRGRVMAVDTPSGLSNRLKARDVVRAKLISPRADSPDEVRAGLSLIPGVGAVAVDEPDPDGVIRIRLESATGVDLRAEVAAQVVGNGWRLIELTSETMSLEDVFLQLTVDSDPMEPVR